jgi:proteasome lid subunit RPN8/RPN11
MNQYKMHISSKDILLLQEHAEKMLPSEAVALIFGTISDTAVSAKRIELMENTSSARLTSFSVNPESEYALLMDAEARNESLVGIFHSHPAPPRPSATDMRNMRLNPVVWLIASKLSRKWTINGYLLEKDKPLDVAIHVYEQDSSSP